jgi:hypothetical protein
MGDKGSPYRTPLTWYILSLGLLLSKTLVLAVDNNTESQSLQRARKPMCSKTSSENGQATKSKARAISTLSRRDGRFLMCRSLVVPYATLKLSWIKRPFTNALWLTQTNSPSLGMR